MTVLFLDQFGELGGAQLCLLDLIPAAMERGWRAVAAVPGEGPLAARLEAAGAEVVALDAGPYTPGRKTLGDMVRYAARVWRLAARIDHLCERYEVDLVHVNGPRLLPAVALGRRRTAVLFHAHSAIGQPVARRLACWALRKRRAAVVAVSRFVAGSLRNGVPAERVCVVPSGAGDLRRARARTGPPVIGVLGRIAPEKGQLEFVRAARLIAAEMPECRYVVIGSANMADPAYEREVRAAARALPVEFTGWRDDIAQALATIDVLAVPSTGEEALGRVVIEAFSAGVPVVAFASGGIPELIEDGKTGFLAHPRTAEALASRLLETARNPARLEAVAQNARSAWESNFTLALYRERMTALMAREAARAPTAPR
ncbi:MAG: glycosyltransferase family 4 protein [Bryobacteraceae bacterium]|nr:glycosyltransferase family 4 protein [Bryobacteraceae bacterium]